MAKLLRLLTKNQLLNLTKKSGLNPKSRVPAAKLMISRVLHMADFSLDFGCCANILTLLTKKN